MRRILLALITTCALLAGMAQAPPPASAQSPAALTPTVPVIFVHGFQEGAWVWDTMIADLVAEGHQANRLFNWQYQTTVQSNEGIAADFGAYLDQVLTQTGASEVDIVSHSMGSLNTRWCIKFGSCAGKVRRWVSLAGANHGTTVAQYCFDTWGTITCAEMIAGSPFLTTLNSTPEIPADLEATTLWTPNDGIINPASSTLLAGALNIAIDPSLNHLTLLEDPGVADQVRALLEAPETGTVAGTVTGEDTGLGLPGHTVRLYRGSSQIGVATAGADGQYAFANLSNGPDYHVQFEATASYLPEANGDAVSVRTSQPVAVSGGLTTLVDAALTPRTWRAGITGTVTDRITGAPISGASVQLYLDDTLVRARPTAADGRYSFSGLDPAAGTWKVRFARTFHRFIWFTDRLAIGPATPLDLVVGATLTVDAGLTRQADLPVLEGSVTADGTATPLAGIEVRAYQDGLPVALTSTDAAGEYALTTLAPGTYHLRFYDASGTWQREWWDDHQAKAPANPITLEPRTTVVASASLAAG